MTIVYFKFLGTLDPVTQAEEYERILRFIDGIRGLTRSRRLPSMQGIFAIEAKAFSLSSTELDTVAYLKNHPCIDNKTLRLGGGT